MADKTSAKAYWAANVRIILLCLVIWFVCSFGLGILLRPALSGISVGGADLGFWFAQNGSIYVFVALIFYYCAAMDRLEKKYRIEG
jgi:putative solute:sodium symporter small subunit